jgi:peptidoglycan/xylan/chitin deacetylase (PgdA/CDA1 family)
MVRGILGNHESPMLHLTFDDGPDPVWTPAVLDALAAARATATFFVLGERAAAWPWVVERILAAGHGVEVHGHGHLRHPLTRRECVEGDLEAALAVLRVHGVVPRLWRAPWGEPAPFTAEVAREHGLQLAGWTADTLDWRGISAEAMVSAIKPELVHGTVVLAHDALGLGALREGCEETVRLIRPLVDAGRRLGLEPQRLEPREDLPPGDPDSRLAVPA